MLLGGTVLASGVAFLLSERLWWRFERMQFGYRANAESENQHARYIRLRSILEGDPEWHDGEVLHHPLGADTPTAD